MGVRADKFIWAVRLAKTRADASEALRSGRILVNSVQCKPSRELRVGDVLGIKRMPAIFSMRIKDLLERRVGAKLVADYIEDITPEFEIDKFEMARLASVGQRERGTGRPTKHDRRKLEEFLDLDD